MAGETTRDLRSDLARVRGLGSAKEGVAHWWAQRLTALALVPLALWFVGSVVSLVGASQGAVLRWIGSPVSAVLMISLLIAVFHHTQLGLQVVIEDYVHHAGVRIALLIIVKGAAFLLALAGVLAVLQIAVRG